MYDFYEHLVQMPLPIWMRTKFLNPSLSDLSSKHRAEPVPTEPHSLMVDVDPPLMQKILNIAKWQWESNIHHHGKTDNFGRGLEVAKGARFYHTARLRNRPARLKLVLSDSALQSLKGDAINNDIASTPSFSTQRKADIITTKVGMEYCGFLTVCSDVDFVDAVIRQL